MFSFIKCPQKKKPEWRKPLWDKIQGSALWRTTSSLIKVKKTQTGDCCRPLHHVQSVAAFSTFNTQAHERCAAGSCFDLKKKNLKNKRLSHATRVTIRMQPLHYSKCVQRSVQKAHVNVLNADFAFGASLQTHLYLLKLDRITFSVYTLRDSSKTTLLFPLQPFLWTGFFGEIAVAASSHCWRFSADENSFW